MLPLAVDLDGTLIRCDLFTEAMLRLLFARPWLLPLLLIWLLRGRSFAKAKLARAVPTDACILPYDRRVLDWLRGERARGRTLALATASDRLAAEAVAAHLDLFDRVFASDGAINLKARRKAERLADAFPDGFVYAGNEPADFAVWTRAAGAVVVNAGGWTARAAAARFAVERSFAREPNALRALLGAARPRHWAKNLLVFAAPAAGQGWFDIAAWQAAAFAFVGLCLVASGVYLINDCADIDADRRHPRKRARAFASGAASPSLGLAAATLFIAAGLWAGAAAGVVGLMAAYLGAAALYTFWLKRLVLIDVFVLAGLYVLRIVIGGAASSYAASEWLLAFSAFFFFSLALVKRAAEVDALRRDLAGRGYRGGDGPLLKRLGVGAALMSALVLAFYLQAPEIAARYGEPMFLWTLPTACLFWLARMWLKVERGEMHDDPVLFALRDPAAWAALAAGALGFAAAILA